MKKNPFWDVPVVLEKDAKLDPYPKDARVVIPEGSEAERIYKDALNNKVCGFCTHCRLKEGQEMFKDQQLFEELFDRLSLGHNRDWYGRLDMFAMCAKWDGHMVHLMAPARIPKYFLHSDCTYDDKDESTACPDWAERGKGVRGTPHYVGKQRNYEE